VNARLKRYLPWLIPLGLLLGYELIAALSQAGIGPRRPTLSELVWGLDWPWLKWVVLALFIWLWWHFFRRRKG